ncbi:hypothetical protein B0A49_06250 [Cryomyces minteri]|uniref:Uncharacterized protein n=1 Tax=Cryomyces minteri TaxID=331657 RepID=A0A4U0X3H4_9PEZI|nr:hypothetical protein B0A49_06250 [Cryomyces minteri]
MPSGVGNGTNPIHNKKPKKAPKGEEDEEDKAFKLKQQAAPTPLPRLAPPRAKSDAAQQQRQTDGAPRLRLRTDKKARDEMANKAKGKGPLNAGQQGIKKSGKK